MRLFGLVLGLATALLAVLILLQNRGSVWRGGSVEGGLEPRRDPLFAIRADGPYLHADGAILRDARGRQVRLTGINWFGLETCAFAPDGLGMRSWWDLLDQARALGFNTIRLPFSDQLLDPGSYPLYINYSLNPDLRGLTGLQVMDRIVHGAAIRGLRIILDRHRPGCQAQSPLWYTTRYTEKRWIADLVRLVRRYRDEPAVIGVDLHNEPHNQATWGDGKPATDWRLAAERAGDAVLRANPHLLVFVQGVQTYQRDTYWWGGNLEGAATAPVRLIVPGRLVYEAHDYGAGVYWQGWFSAPNFPRNLPSVWRRHWAYLQEDGVAPVLLGEFGGRSAAVPTHGQTAATAYQWKEALWQRALVAYLASHTGVSFMYWSLTPDSSDTGGILNDDWQTANITKEALLKPILGRAIPVSGALPAPPEVRVLASDVVAPGGAQQALTLRIVDDGARPLNLAHAELRYWTGVAAPHPETSPVSVSPVAAPASAQTDISAEGQSRVAVVDWASIGASSVVPGTGHTDGYGYVALRVTPPGGAELTVAPYGGATTIVLRLHRADWTPYAPDRDWSFMASAAPIPAPHLTLDVNGARVWGQSPGYVTTTGRGGDNLCDGHTLNASRATSSHARPAFTLAVARSTTRASALYALSRAHGSRPNGKGR